MTSSVWTLALKTAADPRRARHFLELLGGSGAAATLKDFDAEQARVLTALFSGSQALGDVLVAHPRWLETLALERLQYPRRKQGLQKETAAWLLPCLAAQDYSRALSQLREFKQREMLRLAARDLARLGPVTEIVQELSDVADICLDGVWQVCYGQLAGRYGEPYHLDASERWQKTGGCVLGMGKLGGQELNYSSDVDVLFIYTEEGSVFRELPTSRKAPRSLLTNHQFFNRLAEALVAEVGRLAPEGMLYRIDLRLRPEGETSPLTRSLASYENYYAQWGQTWERMMLIKARGVAGNEALAAEFLELIQPFRYPRSSQPNWLAEVAAMKARIENEVLKADELERNVKLGRGGIREIEFIAQSQQLLHAGRQPFLQSAQTLPVLEKLAQYELISPAEATSLATAYCFLRDTEHRLQMEANLQTHCLPTERAARERLARLMQFKSLAKFQAAYQQHTRTVRRVFEKKVGATVPPSENTSRFPRAFEGAEQQWKQLLTEHRFKDPDKGFRTLREFVEGPGYVHVSPRVSDLARHLLPRLFALCLAAGQPSAGHSARILSDPDRVLTRLDSFIARYGARATLFELWNSNAMLFDLLLLLFDRSEFLAELAIRTPDLVDELVTSGRLRQRKGAEETLRDLRHGLADADQFLWLRRYHQAELMRIGLRDILGLSESDQYLTELSALADASLQYSLEAVMRRHRLKRPPFAIIGLGKLGGAEIDYGSDLDVMFVAQSKSKNLPKLARLAIEFMELISSRTEHGIVFHLDARLRPDGEKGLLVTTLDACQEYYSHRAQLWELQTLTRTRPVAGDVQVGARFQQLAAACTDFRQERQQKLPAAYTPDWKKKIHQMRLRIEKERTPAGKDELAIKTGKGGLMDAEFIAQIICLENGWQEANTLRALERARELNLLPDAEKLIAAYRALRRVEGILRRWSYEGETVLPDDPAPYYRVSVRCGFASPEEFRAAMAGWRKAVREVYLILI